MTIYKLDERIAFPYPEYAEEDGLLAVGGDLSMDRLLLAYENGIFPWYNEGEEILWWCPKERYIIRPDKVHISKTMKRIINSGEFKVTFNNDFYGVITSCKEIRENEEGTWITDDMRNAYLNLFNNGYASSVEVYKDEELVGGIYGVKIGKCFFGESMFSKVSNGSKMALIALCKKLEEEKFKFLDCQFHTEHLESMGGESINWNEFTGMLKY
ncbi:leucyl/phenylalanyl-tRNA--protein transferase [Clostridium gasigenes]|uniref:leucyl/phenylalanyl-tRNA--protein transferase n=1 Tax=Clostridium gasigenes TaxID=94869 RepID=UPI00143851E8|nr:leucyl/phenylalanyl-tRNA--protein transferase [Clostridium gasigenes]NKF05885.1 leucyl/phenylalanyl-tRNA--protein transferase [Clostridium gasigenes]QSW19385.1 leucyl/phenylalanyl-tRNA--protein transferase [Clostridium gasigenes]